jgi:hypothetical protein
VDPAPGASASPAQPHPVQHQAPHPPPANTVSPGTVDLRVASPSTASATGANALCSGCDVVLVSICSLRRDHLGAYGDDRGLTPTINAFAKSGVRFTQAYAGANFTPGSRSAMLSGSFGRSTSMLNWGRGLPSTVHTLPEVLGIYGYAATGFRPDYLLQKGFQRMVIIDPPRDTAEGRLLDEPIGPGGATAAPMAQWNGAHNLPSAESSAEILGTGQAPPIPKTGDGTHETTNRRLSDLRKNPDQSENLADVHAETVTQLLDRWGGFPSARAERNVPQERRLDPSIVELLRTTGYDFRPLEL